MVNNCVTIKNFEVPGITYIPGMELSLSEVLLDDWVRRGFVKRLSKGQIKRRTARATTAVSK